jgi:hypothetical protein
MSRNYLAFDIETAKIPEEGKSLQEARPLGICCWATAWMEDGEIKVETGHGNPSGSPSPMMSVEECVDLVDLLKELHFLFDYTILTHNGVGFDLDILAEESGMRKECAELAMNSVDTMFHFFCLQGYPVGLDAISKGMGLKGKTEGMHGGLAPVMWAEGKFEEVLAYVTQDVISTLEVALAVEKEKRVKWISKRGKLNIVHIPRWLTAEESLTIREPDTSWMTDPMRRSKFLEWMK